LAVSRLARGDASEHDIGYQWLPDYGAIQAHHWDATPTPVQLALARGHRGLALLESGEAKSMQEIARREGVDDSYVSRMVNLTTLAPDIVAAILDETLPPEVTLFALAAGTPLVWEEQWGRVRPEGRTYEQRAKLCMEISQGKISDLQIAS
jgi:hypothetical protein